jgi:predicted nucleotidyltransferase
MTESLSFGRDQTTTSAQVEEDALDTAKRDRLVSRLQLVLPQIFDHQPVGLAYLYGSTTTGQTTPFSDVDIALVVDEGLSPYERLKLTLRLQLDLADRCDISNVDVRIINDAPLVFQGRAVCDGILVYAREEQERIEFETGTRLRYFDYLPVHKRLQNAFFADLRERGLYG